MEKEGSKAKEMQLKKFGKNSKGSDEILDYQGILYVPKIIISTQIDRHNHDLLLGYFYIKKIHERITK